MASHRSSPNRTLPEQVLSPSRPVAALSLLLLEPDEATAGAILKRSIETKGFDATIDQLIRPVMEHIGRLWETGNITVADEHLVSAIINRIVVEHTSRLDHPRHHGDPKVAVPAGTRKAVVACVEGNRHALGAEMLATNLQMEGWNVYSLGSDVPTQALLDFVARHRPDHVFLSISLESQLAEARHAIRAVRSLLGADLIQITVGGHGVPSKDVAMALGADRYAPGIVNALQGL